MVGEGTFWGRGYCSSFASILSQCSYYRQKRPDSRVIWRQDRKYIERTMLPYVLSVSTKNESRHFDTLQRIWLSFVDTNMWVGEVCQEGRNNQHFTALKASGFNFTIFLLIAQGKICSFFLGTILSTRMKFARDEKPKKRIIDNIWYWSYPPKNNKINERILQS